jgi:hypothetical protein
METLRNAGAMYVSACPRLDPKSANGILFPKKGCSRRNPRQVRGGWLLAQRYGRPFWALTSLFPWLAAGFFGCGGSSNSATATLGISATTIAFGDVSLNTTVTQSVALTSTGAAPVTVSSVTVSGAGFLFSGASFPLTLNSSTPTATLSVEFDPTSAGPATGQLTVTSNSSINGTADISLTGTGVTGAASSDYQVDLTWDAPSSSPDPVAGYNIYRSPSGESNYQLMGSVSLNELVYTDTNNIQNGQTYDYIVESFDSSDNESVPSNIASVTIPN